MLKSVIRTDEETKEYLIRLKRRLEEQRKAPVEGMAEFFAARINEYESVHLDNYPEIYEHTADFLDVGINSLLDIGCGTGLELKSVFRRFPGLSVTGIDLSAAMLDKLCRNYPDKDVRLIKDDYFRYPFDEKSFDGVVSVETLHHFTYEDKIRIFEKFTARSSRAEAICNAIILPAATKRKGFAGRNTSTGVKEISFPTACWFI